MSRNSLLKNGAFEVLDIGTTSATVASGTLGAKVAAGWYFDNSPNGGTNKTFTTLAGFPTAGSVAAVGNPKGDLIIGATGTETAPGTSAKALLYQKVYGTREESSDYGCFSFWAKCSGAKTAVIELRRNYGSGGSADDVIARKVIQVDSTWRQFFCAGIFPDYATRTFAAGDFIQVSVYLQAGSAVFSDSTNPFVEHALAISSATANFAFTAAKLEIDSAVPSAFSRDADSSFRSELQGHRLASIGKQTLTNSIDLSSASEVNLVDPTGGAITLTLPLAASAANVKLTFKRITAGANAVTIAAGVSDTIDGAASVALTALGDKTTLVSNGVATWYAI